MNCLSAAGLQYRFIAAPDNRAPLCLMLHGRSGDLTSMGVFGRCLPEGFNVVYLQAPLRDPDGGFSWWLAADERSHKDRAQEAATGIRNFLYQVVRTHDLYPSYQLAIGFSQGAAVLTWLLQMNPRLFDCVALLSGFVVRLSKQESLRICGGKEKSRVFMGHGSSDETISVERAREDVEHLRSLGYEVVYVEEDGGHKSGIQTTRALKQWLMGQGSRLSPFSMEGANAPSNSESGAKGR